MNKLVSVLIFVLLTPGFAAADPVLDESTVKGISEELKQGVMSGDITPFKKYLYSGSKIVVDLDPSSSEGQVEISYDDYINLMEMTLPLMQGAVIQDEVLSISIDEKSNQATIREKSNVTVEVMGTKIRDVSISETTYGIVDGQIKALSATDELISSEQLN